MARARHRPRSASGAGAGLGAPAPPRHLFLQWLVAATALTFGLWLTWELGVLALILDRDPTYLSYLIGVLFLGATAHCGLRAHFLSRQADVLAEMVAAAGALPTPELRGGQVVLGAAALRESLTASYLHAILTRYGAQNARLEPSIDHGELTEVFTERVRGPHEVGWFLAASLVKLGLLGTVIGFVMMLGSLSGMESLSLEDVQSILSRMAVGMGVALNTTLMGLSGSMLLGAQYLILDRGADKYIAQAGHYAQTTLIPALMVRETSVDGGR